MKEPKKRIGAPIGNQNGVGHGRPPNCGFSNHELLVLGEELLLWMEQTDENGTEVVHLSEWYSAIKHIPRSQWKSLIQRDCFLPYYEKAMDWLGVKLLKNKNLPVAYGSRFLGIYFREIREYEQTVMQEKIDYELAQKSVYDRQGLEPEKIIKELRKGVQELTGHK
ncbi:MAG TPA: hypothetical protein VLE95_04745 [Chlamydiales bacterium]|nr:hypothetical protein [Chlamydiales bacterium]